MKDETGDVIAMVNKKDATEFITGESCPNSDKDDHQSYGSTIFKGTGTNMIDDVENDPVTTLGEMLQSKPLPPNKSVKNISKILSNAPDYFSNINDDYLNNLYHQINWWRK